MDGCVTGQKRENQGDVEEMGKIDKVQKASKLKQFYVKCSSDSRFEIFGRQDNIRLEIKLFKLLFFSWKENYT